MTTTTLNIHIERWSAWAPGLETPEQWQQWTASPQPITTEFSYPKLTMLPSMMRRRLSNLGKIALKVCYDCHDEQHKLPTIFASRHGEANQTVAILADIIKKQPVSPTKFSLSVHNTSSGLYTITAENTNPSTAIAARLDSFEMGFVEAYALLASKRQQKVLLVYADTPLDPPFDILVDYEPPFAAAFLLTAHQSDTSVTLTMQPRNGAPLSSDPHGFEFMKFLLGPPTARTQLVTDRLAWTWSRS